MPACIYEHRTAVVPLPQGQCAHALYQILCRPILHLNLQRKQACGCWQLWVQFAACNLMNGTDPDADQHTKPKSIDPLHRTSNPIHPAPDSKPQAVNPKALN